MINSLSILDNSFFDEGIKKPLKVINNISKGKIKLKTYFLVVFSESNGRIEILSSRLFLLKYYRNKSFILLALFKNYEDCLEYVRCFTDISYSMFGVFDVLKTIKHISLNDISDLMYKEDSVSEPT